MRSHSVRAAILNLMMAFAIVLVGLCPMNSSGAGGELTEAAVDQKYPARSYYVGYGVGQHPDEEIAKEEALFNARAQLSVVMKRNVRKASPGGAVIDKKDPLIYRILANKFRPRSAVGIVDEYTDTLPATQATYNVDSEVARVVIAVPRAKFAATVQERLVRARSSARQNMSVVSREKAGIAKVRVYKKAVTHTQYALGLQDLARSLGVDLSRQPASNGANLTQSLRPLGQAIGALPLQVNVDGDLETGRMIFASINQAKIRMASAGEPAIVLQVEVSFRELLYRELFGKRIFNFEAVVTTKIIENNEEVGGFVIREVGNGDTEFTALNQAKELIRATCEREYIAHLVGGI